MARRLGYAAALLLLCSQDSVGAAQNRAATDEWLYLTGNVHAHSSVTWSHGDMLERGECKGVRFYMQQPGMPRPDWYSEATAPQAPCPAMIVAMGWQYRGPQTRLKPQWGKLQGPPTAHFAAARAAGFDFYAVTDHSQEAAFFPPGLTNPRWIESKHEAAAATRDGFVALSGYEYSENDGPGGTGHINVLNADAVINAMSEGSDLAAFYTWLSTAKGVGGDPLVGSFNHPNPGSYAKFTGRTPAATEAIALIELINSDRRTHYPGFLAALDAGWKVSPVAGIDNHGLGPIPKAGSRTVVLAKARTRAALLAAMRARRTYATFDRNLRAHYRVNGQMMGSTLRRPGRFDFDIRVDDPDATDPRARIVKVDIVKDGGVVVASHRPQAPGTSLRWRTQIKDPAAGYFFVRVWSAGGGDVAKVEPTEPVAWLAPVWAGTPMPAQPMLPADKLPKPGSSGE